MQTAVIASNSLEINKDGINLLEAEGVKVISYKDNKNRRFVKTVDNSTGIISTADYNKKKNTLTLQTGDEEPVFIDLNLLEQEAQEETSIGLMATTTAEYTFSNYEYIITHSTPRKWELRRPQPNKFNYYYYKHVTETTSNRTNLNNFKKEVDKINDLEWKFIGQAIGVNITTALTVILTAVTMSGAAGAGLFALGLTGSALNTALDLERACKNAQYYYFLV